MKHCSRSSLWIQGITCKKTGGTGLDYLLASPRFDCMKCARKVNKASMWANKKREPCTNTTGSSVQEKPKTMSKKKASCKKYVERMIPFTKQCINKWQRVVHYRLQAKSACCLIFNKDLLEHSHDYWFMDAFAFQGQN